MNELMNTSLITVLGEQLELANEKIERLQKAVDLAIRGLEKVHRANSCITKESQIAYEHLKEIKQLIKGE